MPLVLDACTQVSYVLIDREETKGKMQIHFSPVGAGAPPLTFDDLEAEVIGNLGAWAPGGTWAAIQALSDCPIASAAIGVAYHEDSAALIIGAGEAEAKGNFQFGDSNGEFTTITIPGILDTVLDRNGRSIDPTNAAVAAFVTAMLDQAGAADVRSLNNLPFLALDEAWKAHRQSSKSGQRRSG